MFTSSSAAAVSSADNVSPRSVWMLTYTAAASGLNERVKIDTNTFAEYGRLAVDECYSVETTDAMKKTTHALIHLKTKSRDTGIKKFIVHYHSRNLNGAADHPSYDYTISSFSTADDNMKVHEHPSFAILFEHYRMGSSSMYSWVENASARGGGIFPLYLNFFIC